MRAPSWVWRHILVSILLELKKNMELIFPWALQVRKAEKVRTQISTEKKLFTKGDLKDISWMISIWGWWTEGVTFREWDRQEKTGCFLCNLVNTGAQWTNKPNYKFANSFNLRDAKEENIFFFFFKQESYQGKSQTRFGVCTFPSVYFRAWEVQRPHREGMHHLLLLH